MARCPHGDETCPCQDGDSCHYERTSTTFAWPCPTMPPGRRFGAHCHVEGCEWHPMSVGSLTAPRAATVETCGLLRIAPDTTADAGYELGCGSIRRLVHSSR